MIVFMSLSMSGFESQSYGETLGTFLFWYFERVSFFCSPGWPGISDPSDGWGYRCVSPHPARICLLKFHSCFVVIWISSCLEMRSESEPYHATVPCLKVFLISHLEDCFQFQFLAKPAARP